MVTANIINQKITILFLPKVILSPIWTKGMRKITISAIARYDEKDSERRYIDFQKLKYEQYFENYTFKIGNEIIFGE